MKRIATPSLFNLSDEMDFYNAGEHGNCFHAAFVLFLQMYVNNSDELDFEGAMICHGAVALPSTGQMIIHGWVEARFTGVEDYLVFDASAVGQSMTVVSKQQYYRHAKTRDSYVRKYDLGEFIAIANHTEHTGIWEHPRTAVSDVIESEKLIPARYWRAIRARRGGLRRQDWLRSICELVTRLKSQEALNV